MNSTNCPQCNSPLRLVPAGFSQKTQKPYPAFWGCSNPQCKYTFNEPTATTRPAPVAPVVSTIPINREDSIAWLNAKNNACLLIAHHSHFAKEEDLKTAIENLTYVIYRTTKEKVAKKFAPKPAPVEAPKEPDSSSDIDVEEIPF